MFSKLQAEMHDEAVPKPESKRSSWFRFASLACVGLVVAIGTAVVCIQFREVRQLRNAASRVQIGDSQGTVHSLLGSAIYHYESGWPSAGAPPAEYGDMYGGRLNYLREDIASFVDGRIAGGPRYSISQGVSLWPVIIRYNGDKRVTAVYIDGIKVK
ncbi:MAG: hypothetical protein V4719_23135 [Planctomycetota bacterium]